MNDLKHYILFSSYNSGLALESILKKEKVKYTIVPTPRELSACCGIAIQYNKVDEETIKVLIEGNSIQVAGFHSLNKVYKDFYL
jgi:ribosomal protein L7Ae-like RNA K-turn-binding protein